MNNIVSFPRPSRRDDRDPDIAPCGELYGDLQDKADALVWDVTQRMKGLTERQFSIVYESIHDEFHAPDRPSQGTVILMQLARRENEARERPDTGGAA